DAGLRIGRMPVWMIFQTEGTISGTHDLLGSIARDLQYFVMSAHHPATSHPARARLPAMRVRFRACFAPRVPGPLAEAAPRRRLPSFSLFFVPLASACGSKAIVAKRSAASAHDFCRAGLKRR